MTTPKPKFNIFGPSTKCDVKVGYISTDRGYISGVGIHDANVYAKKNPGTTFIFQTRENIRYLNINEVNKLNADDLESEFDTCKGIQMDGECGGPVVNIAGGGGVGAQANPVIDRDGSVIALDLVHGGHGYQFPPQVEVVDRCGVGAGAVAKASLGSTITVFQTYEDEEDFEEYDLKSCAPEELDFGDNYDLYNSKKIGKWNPKKYTDAANSPFDEEVKEYQDLLRKVQNPWWTTHKEAPLRVTGNGKTSRTFHKVTDHRWEEFQNSYAISPVPPSNAKGSDFSNRWYTFEWDLDVPYDGEYIFRGTKDNRSKLYVDNQFVSNLSNYEGTVKPIKKTLTEGKHQLKIELFNVPFIGKRTVQKNGPKAETQIAGADFIKKSNGFFLTVGGNVETEVVVQLWHDDNPGYAGVAIEKIIIPNPDGEDIVLEREKEGGRFKEHGTIDGKSVFKRSEDGYGPIRFEGTQKTPKLVRVNPVYGPNSNKYGQIDFFDGHGTDTNAHLQIISAKNLQQQRVVQKGSSSEVTQELKTVFNTLDYIDKANRKLWRTNVYNRGGFLNEYGVCPFDTMIQLEDNPYAGSNVIVWNNVNFPVTGNYIIEVAVDDNVNLKIGDQVSFRKEGFVDGDADKPTGKSRYVYSIKQGTYNITADLEQKGPGGKFGFSPIKGINPMALAINIETEYTEEEFIQKASWNSNPMGVALTIEAPSPPIPQQPIPKAEGRCPPNPFWTTRFPGAKAQWHPVGFKKWHKFLNKYAMSPVPPYDTPNTSGGGGIFTNEWTVDIPYDGYYKLKGAVDDEAKFWVDGQLVLDLTQGSGGYLKARRRGENKFFLSAGSKIIKVEVHNYKFEETKLVDQKIFNTADWVNLSPLPETRKNVTFKISSAATFGNGIKIPGLNIDISKTQDGPQINETIVKDVPVNQVYDVELTSPQSKHGVRLRTKGESVLEMEEYKDNDWKDVVCTATGGRFYDLKNGSNSATCKFIVPSSRKPSIKGTLVGGTEKDGVTYEGPRLASYRSGPLGREFSPFHTNPVDIFDKSWKMKWNNVNFPDSGEYTLKMLADDTLTVRLDGRKIGFVKVFENVRTYTFNVTKGKHTLEMELYNIPAPETHTFSLNPTVGAVIISKKIRVGTGVLRPWSVNPVGVSAKLMPPPCPQVVDGKGVVTDVTCMNPGNGFDAPKGPGYPVGLKLKDVIVKSPGINYDCAVDQVVIEPNEGGAQLSLCDCGPFGRINKVCVDDGGLGFTQVPNIRVISDTGINFEGIPVMEVVRDPIVPDIDKLIQVTDLVGVKQTGYYDGRAYYGAVFYKDGIKYAGYYETPGQLVQIYDTLQESIDAEVTTPPSAILRQGTDISSDDPRLNLPGTPDNLI
tara:strand:+ start:10005 stop:14081 length:4077 start_codon:yes stop_codon:yes gene_type:complete